MTTPDMKEIKRLLNAYGVQAVLYALSMYCYEKAETEGIVENTHTD